jgi:uncharacterized YigZ family protein
VDEYLVPTGYGEDEFIEKKSRFIGRVWCVESEEEALEKIQEMKKQHYDASHNCWAYIIRDGAMRFSDDGEPGGTAGLPMMEVIKAQGVVNCCVVVTRYFGGVLLGAGGLVRAYTQGCVVGLKAAQVVIMEPSQRYICEVSYPLWDKVQYAMKSLPVQVVGSEFAAAVTFTLLVREKDAATVIDELTRVTDGRFDYLLEDESFEAWDTE